MKRLLRPVLALLSSRATSPVIIGIFLLVYIAIAFFTEDALIALMELTRRSSILVLLLAMLPLNVAGRIVSELCGVMARRRLNAGTVPDGATLLYDETIALAASPAFTELQGRLDALGYRTCQIGHSLRAWRGVSNFPVRLLFLAGVFCLFLGIFISLVTRTSYRGAVIEGVALPAPSGKGGIVEHIRLEKPTGRILSKKLVMEVAPSGPGDTLTTCGIYPPTRYQGVFVYPRFLGVGLLVRFTAPDLPAVSENRAVLNLYPAGKEAPLEIPDSPYRLLITMVEPEDGSDPYVTGRMVFSFKLLKGNEVLFSGSAPGGGEFAREGYRLVFPDFRRLVITDFIHDYGVIFIWTAGLMLGFSALFWFPVRLFFPRREMLFLKQGEDMLLACSRAEGKRRMHGGVFNEALDLFGTGRAAKLTAVSLQEPAERL